ncbi:MAG TPA: hypothetical protein VJC08_03175, partial [bacterium]|nr:hypothetical protein [bacterium]
LEDKSTSEIIHELEVALKSLSPKKRSELRLGEAVQGPAEIRREAKLNETLNGMRAGIDNFDENFDQFLASLTGEKAEVVRQWLASGGELGTATGKALIVINLDDQIKYNDGGVEFIRQALNRVRQDARIVVTGAEADWSKIESAFASDLQGASPRLRFVQEGQFDQFLVQVKQQFPDRIQTLTGPVDPENVGAVRKILLKGAEEISENSLIAIGFAKDRNLGARQIEVSKFLDMIRSEFRAAQQTAASA